MQRRHCLKILGTAALVSPLSNVLAFPQSSQTPGLSSSDIYIFSKILHWLDYEGMAKTVKKIGFDGVDLTVRPNGHVQPENVETDLPKAVEALRKAGLKADMMTTTITNIREPFTEKILKTASSLGVKYYRMGWLEYDLKKPIPEQIETFKSDFKELEQMNEHYKISGGYQNHAGTSVGAPVWDIWMLIKDLNPAWLGCQYDIHHAKVEGMNSWKLGLELLKSNMQSLVFKDFIYVKNEKGWAIKDTAIGEGAIDFKKYMLLLNELGIAAPISMHAEYDLGGAEKGAKQITIPAENVVAALQKDLNSLKQLLGKS